MTHEIKHEAVAMRRIVGVVAEFKDPDHLIDGIKKIREAGYRYFDVHTPYPIHGMDDHMKLPPSKLGWISSVAALIGGLSAIGLTWWGSTYSYKIIVSGKEFFSYQAFVPIIFELSILGACFGTVFGMFALNRIPQPYHPIFNTKLIESAGDNKLLISIESKDHVFDEKQTVEFLKKIQATDVELIWEDEA